MFSRPCGQLVVLEAGLVSAHDLSPGLHSRLPYRAEVLSFPERH